MVIVPPELLKSYGWQPWQSASVMEWCAPHRGHSGPDRRTGRWRLIVFEGEAGQSAGKFLRGVRVRFSAPGSSGGLVSRLPGSFEVLCCLVLALLFGAREGSICSSYWTSPERTPS